jgi:hypothetical protein
VLFTSISSRIGFDVGASQGFGDGTPSERSTEERFEGQPNYGIQDYEWGIGYPNVRALPFHVLFF